MSNVDHKKSDATPAGRNPLKDIKLAEWIMIGFTAVTAGAAWAGVYVSNKQWTAMVSSSGDSTKALNATIALKDAGNRQADSAKIQADAVTKQLDAMGNQFRAMQAQEATAKDQLSTNKDTARRQLRAYISVNTSVIERADGVSPVSIKFDILNTGGTPAHDLNVYEQWGIVNSNYAGDCQHGALTPNASHLLLAGGGKSFTSFISPDAKIVLSDEVIKEMMEQRAFYMIGGYVTYKDIYERPWRQNFCFAHYGIGWSSGKYWMVGNDAVLDK